MKKILIADDHPLVRNGLRQILEEDPGTTVSAEATDGQEVLDRIRDETFDLVVLDISMPGRNGIEILKDVKKERPGLPVLILSMHPEKQYAIRAIRAGAAGYITKNCAQEELVDAIKTVATGKRYISSSIADILAEELGPNPNRPISATLSDREYEVLRLIASGITVTKIAERLSLSVKTVSTYRSRILEKTRMKSNSQLTRYALENALVD